MSILSKLAKLAGLAGAPFTGGASAAITADSVRLVQQLARSAEGRASGSDAWRNVQRAEYLANAKGYTAKNGLPS